jgi:hypothetical protein
VWWLPPDAAAIELCDFRDVAAGGLGLGYGVHTGVPWASIRARHSSAAIQMLSPVEMCTVGWPSMPQASHLVGAVALACRMGVPDIIIPRIRSGAVARQGRRGYSRRAV